MEKGNEQLQIYGEGGSSLLQIQEEKKKKEKKERKKGRGKEGKTEKRKTEKKKLKNEREGVNFGGGGLRRVY
jgi:hypothetical protein